MPTFMWLLVIREWLVVDSYSPVYIGSRLASRGSVRRGTGAVGNEDLSDSPGVLDGGADQIPRDAGAGGRGAVAVLVSACRPAASRALGGVDRTAGGKR